MNVSAYRKVAVGVVAENKGLTHPEGGGFVKEVEITPTEWLTMRDGELTDNPQQLAFATTDSQGNAITGKVAGNNTIKCTWMPAGTNRLSPPDVRRGNRVEIWQAANQDKFWWRDMGLDDHLKKLETIVWGISASTQEQEPGVDTVLSPANMYWIEFSSHSKKLAFSSCKANGEPFLYEMYFDFDKGEFNIKDDIGNFINLVSALKLIHLQNAEGTFIKLDEKDIKMYAPQDMLVDVARNMTVTVGKNATVKAGLQLLLDGGGSTQTHTSAGIVVKAPMWDGGP
jgi:hypothetical protein